MIDIKADFKEVRERLKRAALKAEDIPKLLARDFTSRLPGPIATQITRAYPGQERGRIPSPARSASGGEGILTYTASGWQSIKHFGLTPTAPPGGYERTGKSRWPVKPTPYTISFTIRDSNTIGGSGSGIFLGSGSLNGHVYERKGEKLLRYNGIAVPVMITNAAKDGITERVLEIMEKREQNYLNQMLG